MIRFSKLKIIFLSILFFGIFGWAESSLAANYYVATNGNNGNAGTLASPWLAVTYAASRVAAGDTVYIRGGTYAEGSINPNGGTAGNPVTFTRYQNETPVIQGSSGDRGTFFIQGNQYIVLDHLTITGGAANVYLSYDRPAHNITIQYSDLSGWTGGDNNGAIYIDSTDHPDNIVIRYNYIHDTASVNIRGSAGVIIFQARRVTISNNEFSNDGSHGIYYKHSHDDPSITTVENNYFHGSGDHIMWSRRNGIIRNNVMSDSVNGGIHVFEEAAGCANLISDSNSIIHNTIVASGSSPAINLNREGEFGCPGATETTLRDNLIYGWNGTEYQGLGVFVYNYSGMTYPPDGHTRADHNLIYSSGASTPIKVNGTSYSVAAAPLTVNTANIQTAPTFVNYAQRAASLSNLALAAGSAGKNAASDGTDMGANVTLVGPNTGSSSDTTPPASPTGLTIN